MQYTYDENGIFVYFLLSVLTFALIPATFSLLSGPSSRSGKRHLAGIKDCSCDACKDKQARLGKAAAAKTTGNWAKKALILTIGWLFFGFVAYKVATTHLANTGLWDPYEILGVSTSATKNEIKKKFRDLSLIYHPDKVQGTDAEKEAAAKIYNDLSKAQKVLTDEEARKTWDEFGHPDGRQALSLGIALPKFLVDTKNSVLVLFLYGAVFGILLPTTVARWWYSSKNMNNDKIRHETMGKLYKEVKADTNPMNLIDIIAVADELIDAVTYNVKTERAAVEKLAEEIAIEIAKYGYIFQAKRKYTTVGDAITHKIQILLYSHLIRKKFEDPRLAAEQALVAERACLVVAGVLQICAARFWLPVAIAAIDLRQAIVQATLPSKGPLGQLPFMTLETFKEILSKKKTAASPRQLIEMEESERRALLSSFSDAKYKEIISVAEQYPLIRIPKCHFHVVGEEYITPSSIVTLTVTLEHITPAVARAEKLEGPPFLTNVSPPAFNPLEEPKKPTTDHLFVAAERDLMPTHCPYFPAPRYSTWWVMMGNPDIGRLICLGKVSTCGPPGVGEPQSCRLQFQAPPQPGSWKFHVFVKNDSSMGCDMTVIMDLNVVDAPDISRTIVEDDISEPDEDTIAGQMAAIKAGKIPGEGSKPAGRKPAAERDDAEDSSDSEDED